VATKKAGGVIRPRIAGTFEATAAIAVGDPVHVTGVYEVQKADGEKIVIGQVSQIRKDVAATGGNRTATVPGDVTVELFGTGILTFKSGAAIAAAGGPVSIDSTGRVVDAAADSSQLGVALTTAGAAGVDVDVLVGLNAPVTA
jgi:hypothetical protein